MDVQGDGWLGVVSSMGSNSESGEPNQRGHLLSAEDTAWIDSCLASNLEMSDDDWGPIKEALIDVITSTVSLGHRQAATLVGKAISEAEDDIALISEETGSMFLRDDTGDQILTNHFFQEESGNEEAEVASFFPESIELSENIFKVWDLNTEFGEDDFVKQLDKALAESSLTDLPPVVEDPTDMSLDEENVDDLITGISDLSLRPAIN